MPLTLKNVRIQDHGHYATITCDLSGEISLQAAIKAPKRVLNALRPAPKDFLYLACLIALNRQEPLLVDCEIEHSEWQQFVHSYIPIVCKFFALPMISVTHSGKAPETTSKEGGVGKAGLMFSGGVDSFYALLNLQELSSAPDYLISINAGAFPFKPVWNASLPNLSAISQHYRTPLILIDSNFHRVLRQSHFSAHTIRNITAVMLLRGAISTVFYSSSVPLKDFGFARAREIQSMSRIEPLVLYAMKQSNITTVLHGIDVGRISKTSDIHRNPVVQRYLNVCTNWRYQASSSGAAINCGQCDKCARTMFTLEALGSLQSYGSCFNLSEFNLNRSTILERLRNSRLSGDQEVVELMKSTDLKASTDQE